MFGGQAMGSTSGDVFCEVLIQKRLTAADIALRILACAAAVIVAAGAITGFLGMIPFIWIIATAACIAAYLFVKFQNVEFEYIFTSGELDIDKITGKAKRKRALTVNFETMEVLAPENSDALKEWSTRQDKTYDFSSRDKTRQRYVYIGSMDNQNVRIIFEPSGKMVEQMKNYAPRKVKTV